ncbi:PAS domain-containing sensor histidine kinase [Spongiibacter sp.]|uniref:sensor histidine kinase n=1 Tax=Spongiibacter sp. TaxID=2024860 RepID=UPI003562AE43
MRVYSAYRLLLASALFFAFLYGAEQSVLGSTAPEVYSLVSCGYLGFSILVFLQHLLSRREYRDTGLFFEFFIDIGCIMLMSYCSTSADSGLALLLIVSISAASMTLPARLCLSLASLATISAIAEVAANALYERMVAQQFVVAGMMGMAYFTTAIVIRYLTNRISSAQQLAERRRGDVERLSQINQSIVQRMQTGIVVISRSGRIKLCNAAAAELLQIPYQRSPESLFAPPQITAMTASGNSQSKIIQLQPSGIELHINLTHLDQHAEDDFLLYIDNISKINQRAQNLKLASLGRFTASIAHEIRNPLAAISHAAQLLAEAPGLAAADARFVGIIQNHANRMNDIIKNILELSRGRLPEPQPFPLTPWLQRFCRDWHSVHNKELELLVDNSACSRDIVNVDQSQLSQILSNITENGIRHSIAAAGRAKLRFRLSNALGDGVTLDILDNGPGISPEHQDKIFEPFFTTQTQGNGLGLYLCRELCLANQIAISYRRDHNGDSCFRLQFAHPQRGTLPD